MNTIALVDSLVTCSRCKDVHIVGISNLWLFDDGVRGESFCDSCLRAAVPDPDDPGLIRIVPKYPDAVGPCPDCSERNKVWDEATETISGAIQSTISATPEGWMCHECDARWVVPQTGLQIPDGFKQIEISLYSPMVGFSDIVSPHGTALTRLEIHKKIAFIVSLKTKLISLVTVPLHMLTSSQRAMVEQVQKTLAFPGSYAEKARQWRATCDPQRFVPLWSRAFESYSSDVKTAISLVRKAPDDIDAASVKESLLDARCYAWSAETVETTLEASRLLTDDSCLWLDQAPTHGVGYYWFEEPIINGTSRILWATRKLVNGNSAVMFYVFKETSTLVPKATWEVGTSFSEFEKFISDYRLGGFEFTEGEKKDMLAVARFIHASFGWLRQEIVVMEHATVERQRRKLFMRENKTDKQPDVHVVHLRRRVRVPTGGAVEESAEESTSDDGKKINWSCHWVVAPHPRNQWYPSRNRHEVIWIDSYAKGDPSKPLRKHASTVYAVTR